MRRLPLLVAVTLLAAVTILLIDASTPRWFGGPDLAAIDGFLVDGERPCALPPAADCEPQLSTALAVLAPGERAAVTAAAVGEPPTTRADAEGRPILQDVAGFTSGSLVILDIGGRRRVVPLLCAPAFFSAEGAMTRPASCGHAPDSLPRAGWFGP